MYHKSRQEKTIPSLTITQKIDKTLQFDMGYVSTFNWMKCRRIELYATFHKQNCFVNAKRVI